MCWLVASIRFSVSLLGESFSVKRGDFRGSKGNLGRAAGATLGGEDDENVETFSGGKSRGDCPLGAGGSICIDDALSEMWCTWLLELNRNAKLKETSLNQVDFSRKCDNDSLTVSMILIFFEGEWEVSGNVLSISWVEGYAGTVSVAESCPKMCCGSGNNYFLLMEFGLAGNVHRMMMLVVDTSWIPCHFNIVEVLRPRWLDILPLREAVEWGMICDFNLYIGTSQNVSVQQFQINASLCIGTFVLEVGHGMMERASISLNLATLCPASIRHGSLDQFCEKSFT